MKPLILFRGLGNDDPNNFIRNISKTAKALKLQAFNFFESLKSFLFIEDVGSEIFPFRYNSERTGTLIAAVQSNFLNF